MRLYNIKNQVGASGDVISVDLNNVNDLEVIDLKKTLNIVHLQK